MINIRISSSFNQREIERELKKEIGKAAEEQIKSQLSPGERLGLRVRFDGKSSVEVTGPDDLVESAKRKLS